MENQELYLNVGGHPVTFLIWSNQHNAWWGPNHIGYVTEKHLAGHYSLHDAVAICLNANLHDPDVPSETIYPYEPGTE